MFKYDDVYNRLFENEEFVDILCRFHSSNWRKMDKTGRFKVIEDFVKKYCEILDINPAIKVKPNGGRLNSGSYFDIRTSITVNENAIEEETQYDVLDTLFHELRHNFQHRAISRNLSEFESVNEEDRLKWKLNALISPRGYGNYVSAVGENSYLYNYQPTEKDAFMSGLALTKKSYDLIKSKLGEDGAFVEYAILNKGRIMLYFSEEKAFVESLKNGEEAVLKLFAENNKEIEVEKKCLKIAKETMKKEIEDMSLEEIISLFSVYVWPYLEDDYKISLLEEYDGRVNKYKKAKITKEGNSMFKVCGRENLREDIGAILNNLFSFEYAVYAEALVKGKEPCDPKIREEIALNMHEVDKKRINYVKDTDNFILYSIQPYALYEGRTIIEWFKRVRDVETKVYGVDNGDYKYWVDFYDNDKYIPYIEKFYDKPFEEIYGELVESMRKKANISKRN